jgi:L-ascorbate metabolism protein UlaG (beta-lactamase superfamily)
MKKKLLKFFRRMLITLLILVIAFVVVAYFYMRQPQFGKAPEGARLERIKQSPNYKDGQFQNRHHTPSLTEGFGYTGVLWNFIFGKDKRSRPADSLPSVKTDLLHLSPEESVVVWMGHSSYFIQADGKRFLVDPVLSGSASPLPGGTRAFKGADIYTVDDLPPIDYLLITHDHYDHLDYKTITRLRPKVSMVICGLGVGSHLEYWDYEPAKIIEKDWDETAVLPDGFAAHVLTGRHFSGRTLSRNNTLWVSFLLETPHRKIFVGGDSGYDTHFAEIGNRFGEIDLAILENGQYNAAWRYIHMFPEEVWTAARELNAKRLLPVHSGKFVLGNHAWDEPLIRLSEAAAKNPDGVQLCTPMIGEKLLLDSATQACSTWWKNAK